MNRTEYRDLLAQKHTAFPSFQSLLNAQGGYRPSLFCSAALFGVERADLADAYDAAQRVHGDPRRALRS